MLQSGQRPKSAIKSEGINRFDAHEYEKTIQNLLEKIELLESRLLLVYKDKYDVTNEKEFLFHENKDLKDELEDENNKNIKLTNLNSEFKQTIKDLKTTNKNIKDRADVQIKNRDNQINDQKKEINKLNNQIDLKNDKIKNYSVDNRLMQKTSNEYRNILNKQMKINKRQNKKLINLEKQVNDYAIKKKDEAALLLEIELLRKDNIRLLKLLNTTEEYKDFCYLEQTSPGGIRYIHPREELKAPVYKPLSQKEERARSLKEYKKYKAKKEQKLEKEDRNWVPIEAYNFLVESKNKHGLDLNNDTIEKLLLILNKFWQERLAREINHYRALYQNEIKDLKVKLERDRDRGTDFYISKTSTNFFNPSFRQTKTSYFDSNAFQKKLSSEPSTGTDDIFYKTASNLKDRKSLENEVLSLRQKLEEKNNDKKSSNEKIYNQGNLVMTNRTIDEIKKLKKKVDDLYKEYEERVRNSVDNNLDNVEYRKKVINDSVKIFFSSVKKAINDIDTKMSNWKFNLKMHLGGMKYAKKNN